MQDKITCYWCGGFKKGRDGEGDCDNCGGKGFIETSNNTENVITATDKLVDLLARCKCGVFLTVNQHRDFYETAAQSLEEKKGYECPPEIDDAVRQKMIETDTIIELQFYPDTPVGSYSIYHYDLDAALVQALECLK